MSAILESCSCSWSTCMSKSISIGYKARLHMSVYIPTYAKRYGVYIYIYIYIYKFVSHHLHELFVTGNTVCLSSLRWKIWLVSFEEKIDWMGSEKKGKRFIWYNTQSSPSHARLAWHGALWDNPASSAASYERIFAVRDKFSLDVSIQLDAFLWGNNITHGSLLALR